ncbi:MAG TPA: serine/threonine-protein kinase [Microbacteriaceae bacterium]
MADGDGKPKTLEAGVGTLDAGVDTMIGAVLGDRYRVRGLLGRGGMASVYRADDELLKRQVAVKLFESDGGDANDLRRETSEIRTLASLNHHGLVTVFDANVSKTDAKDRAYLVMELVDGPTLRQRIRRGPIAPEEVAVMAADLAEALHVVHAAGIVHRDIKPDNVLLAHSTTPDREFRAKLADFGIAFLGDSTRHTTPGTVLGTAAYLSPEQARGDAPSPASDIYQLGLVLLECFTGIKAFPGSIVESVSAKLASDPGIPDDLAPECASLLRAMTARDPDARPSAWAVAEAAVALGRPATNEPAVDVTLLMDAATDVVDGATADAATQTDLMLPSDTKRLTAPLELRPDNATRIADETLVLGVVDYPAYDRPTADELTDVLTTNAPVSTSPESSERVPNTALDASEPRYGGRRHRGPWIALVIALLVVIAFIVIVVMNNTTAQPTPAVTLPPVGGALGDHLNQLLGSVTP